MFERYTPTARKAIVMAQEEARVHQTLLIEIDHVLLGVLRMAEDPAVTGSLAALTGTIPELYAAVETELPIGPARPEGHIPFAGSTKDVIRQALQEALTRKDAHIGCEHLLLAIVAVGGSRSSAAMEERGATHQAMLAALGGETGPGFQVRTTKGFGRFRKGGKDRGAAT